MNRWLVGCLLSLSVGLAGSGAGAVSAADRLSPSIKVDEKEPVYLEADELGYDQNTSTVEAIGKVQITQGEQIVLADRVSYNQMTNVVTASGNVSVLEPDGNVYFADDVRLKEDVSEGVVRSFRARLKDNSLFAAREAQKINDHTTVLHGALYTPCTVCARDDGTDKPPLWQIKAQKATIDEEAQRIYYRNAFFEVYGLPLFYTPYYSHPTPDAPSKSGLLTPEYSHDKNLGTVVKAPVFLAIKPNMDATITPIYTADGPVLAAEFEHLTPEGKYQISGSATNGQAFDNAGNRLPGKDEMRGHVQGRGDLNINDIYGWGFDFKRATDDTYMLRYHFGYDDVLTSQLYVNRMVGRDYAILEGLSFQGLEITDSPDASPAIIPVFDMHTESKPMWGSSRLFFTANAYSFSPNVGSESSRVATTTGWKLPYVTGGGQVFEFNASVRADSYSIGDMPFGTGTFDGNVMRVIPQAEAKWRYPLLRTFENGHSLTLEPTVNLAVSPSRDPDSKIPDQDSTQPELSDINLFSADRFPGYDRIETGPRANYGLRGDYDMNDTRRLMFAAGQAYQQNDDNRFPLGRKTDLHFSDLVGQLGFAYDQLDMSYRFLLNKEDWVTTRNDVALHWAGSGMAFDLNYIALNDAPGIPNQQQVFSGGGLRLHDNWFVNAGARYDFEEQSMRDSAVGLTYRNECITIVTSARHDFFHDRDIQSGTSVVTRVILKNLE